MELKNIYRNAKIPTTQQEKKLPEMQSSQKIKCFCFLKGIIKRRKR